MSDRRAIKLKHTEASGGVMTLQNPAAETGLHGKAYTFEIFGIPQGVSDTEVIRLANATTFMAAKYDGTGRYSYAFGELGVGKIIH